MDDLCRLYLDMFVVVNAAVKWQRDVEDMREYANSVWYPKRKTDIDKIERVQKRATKLIPELSKQEAQLSLRDRATRACQLKSGKVLHKCRRLVFEKLWN